MTQLFEQLQSGPCAICGDVNYPLSYGGPTICPSCDSGDFGLTKIKRQAKTIAELRKELADLKRVLCRRGENPETLTVEQVDMWVTAMYSALLSIRKAEREACAEWVANNLAEMTGWESTDLKDALLKAREEAEK